MPLKPNPKTSTRSRLPTAEKLQKESFWLRDVLMQGYRAHGLGLGLYGLRVWGHSGLWGFGGLGWGCLGVREFWSLEV